MTDTFPHLDGVTHRFVNLPGLRVHLAESGRGDPLLLMHGFPQHWWEWRGVIPALAEHHRVICVDLRGFGWTDAPADGYRRDQLVADQVALLDALGIDRVGLLTHDWGSLVAYQLCLRRPDRVRAHLALSIPPPYLEFDWGMVGTLLRHAWWNPLLAVPWLGPRLIGGGKQALVRHLLTEFATADGEQDVEVFAARVREPERARAGSLIYRHFIQPEGTRMLRGAYRGDRLTTRTRVLIGADDPTMRADHLHGFAEYCDDLEVEYLPGASHFVADDRPDVVAERALAFFAQPQPPRM